MEKASCSFGTAAGWATNDTVASPLLLEIVTAENASHC